MKQNRLNNEYKEMYINTLCLALVGFPLVYCKCQYKNVQKWQNKNVQLFKTNMIF